MTECEPGNDRNTASQATASPSSALAELQDLQEIVGVLDQRYRSTSRDSQPSDEWRAFANACQGLGTRVRAYSEAEQRYARAAAQHNETLEDRYLQDEALFAFFTNGLSAVEVACFVAYAVAAQLRPVAFPLKTEKQLATVTPTFALDQFERMFPSESVTATLSALNSDNTFKELKTIRHVLSHRGTPSRQFSATLIPGKNMFIGGRKGAPPTWCGIQLNAEALDPRRQWLDETVLRILEATTAFAVANIKR